MPSGERSTPEKLGNYQIIERIAAGGMAEVYRARVTGAHGFAKEFALKRILPHLCDEEEFISMLVDEARIMVTLDHPNIVQVHEFAKAEGTYLLAMELIRGRTLFDVEKRSRAIPASELSIPDVLFVGAQTAAALGYAHTRRDSFGNPLCIVHRDISPQNILMSWSGDVKVVDFGVAKAAGKLTATRMGVIKGKFAYMSPEQSRGEALDARSDIFALGVVLWEALAKQRLFRGDSETATLRNVMTKAVPSLAQVDARIPARVAAIIRRALERRVEDRYQDAETLESDLVGMLHRLQPGYTRRHLAERMGELFAPEIADEASRPLPVEHTINSLDEGKPSAPSADEQARKEAQARALAEAGSNPKGPPEPSDAKTKAAAEARSDEQKTVSQRGLAPMEISGPGNAAEISARELSTRGRAVVTSVSTPGTPSPSGLFAVPPPADPGAISASGTATVPLTGSGSAVVPLRSSPLFAAAVAAVVVAVAGLIAAVILTRRPPTTVYVGAPTGVLVGAPSGVVPMGTGVGAPPPTGAGPVAPGTGPAPTGAPPPTGAPVAAGPTGTKAGTGDRAPPTPKAPTGSRKPPTPKAPTGVKVAPAPTGVKAPTGTAPVPPPTPAPAKTGKLSLLSEPWGRVTIDGRAVGNTPLRGVELSAGSHTIEIKNPVTGQGKTFKVTVAPGEDVRKRVTLE